MSDYQFGLLMIRLQWITRLMVLILIVCVFIAAQVSMQ